MHDYLDIFLCSLQFFFLCSTQILLKNIWYDDCFDSTDSLSGDDDGDDDDDTGAISTCGLETTHDVVAEICRNKSYDNAMMPHLFSEISLYIHSFLDVAVWNVSTIAFVC